MDEQEHFSRLENMYNTLPLNHMFQTLVKIGKGQATIKLNIKEEFHHAANAVHGSFYFKVLDDAAYFRLIP